VGFRENAASEQREDVHPGIAQMNSNDFDLGARAVSANA
jgi:hypothetical protein